MARGDAQEGKWRGNWRMEWLASTLHTTSEHGVSSITTADAHTSVPVVDSTDAPADLNGLVRFAERRNPVSARVTSHFKRSLPSWESSTATDFVFRPFCFSVYCNAFCPRSGKSRFEICGCLIFFFNFRKFLSIRDRDLWLCVCTRHGKGKHANGSRIPSAQPQNTLPLLRLLLLCSVVPVPLLTVMDSTVQSPMAQC